MRQVITEIDIPQAGDLRVSTGALITPSARDLARTRGVRIVELSERELAGFAAPETTVAIGSDHGGFEMKERLLKPLLTELKLAVRDEGVFDGAAADYPDIAAKVAGRVASGEAARGIIVDGAGIGSAIAANKIPGIRAALCYDKASARNSREHNDANVLTLGAGLIGTALAKQIVDVWLKTDFGGGRHAKRVDKIIAVEKKYRA